MRKDEISLLMAACQAEEYGLSFETSGLFDDCVFCTLYLVCQKLNLSILVFSKNQINVFKQMYYLNQSLEIFQRVSLYLYH